MKNFSKLMFLFAFTLLLAGCVGQPINNDTIKIGAILPLSGTNSSIGEGLRNAMELAQKDSDKKLEIIFEDGRFETKHGVTAYHKLRDIDKVDVIINTASTTIDAIQPLVDKDPIIVIQIAEANVQKNDTIFQIMPSAIPVYARLGELAAEHYDSVMFVYQNMPILQKAQSVFQEAYKLKNKDGIAKSLRLGESKDNRTLITKILSEDFEAMTFVATPDVGIPFFKQFTELNYKGKTKLLCSGDLEVTISDYLKIFSSDLFEGCYSTLFVDRMSSEFKQLYKETYGIDPSFATDYVYDAVNIISDTYSENIDEWKNNIQKITYEGVSGVVEFDSVGIRTPEVETHIFKDGKFIKYEN